MNNNGDTGSPGSGPSLFVQTNEDVERAVAAATSPGTIRSPRPSVVFSSRDDDAGSPLKRLQLQVARMLKGLSPSPEVKRATYNPEILTSQKRQWARSQMEYLDHRSVKEPSRLFESMVVVGLHPNTNVQELQKQLLERNNEDTKKSRSILNHHHQVHADLDLDPQVLFVYPPEKKLPLKYKDLLSFCFPAGVEVRAVERTPSLSELNQILVGQEQLKQSDVSFVFRLQVADNSTLYGCCFLIEEIIKRPSILVSRLSGEQKFSAPLSRHILTTPRCYCILSRLPFFDLHFNILKSIFTEERYEGLSQGIELLNLLSLEEKYEDDNALENSVDTQQDKLAAEDLKGSTECSEPTMDDSPVQESSDGGSVSNQLPREEINSEKDGKNNTTIDSNLEPRQEVAESGPTMQNGHNDYFNETMENKPSQTHLPNAVLPLIQHYQHERSEPFSSLQGFSSEDRHFRSDMDETEINEPSSSGQEDSNVQNEILNWAKANSHGSLQIICEYYRLQCPSRGSTLTFQPLEHLHPVEFQRPGETVLHIAGSSIDLRSCNTSLKMAEAYGAQLAEEEAAALSVWTVACICGNLRLEHVMLMFAGALLEKQIVVVCSNLGVLSASVLSVIPLIRPYQWESLLMPVLPNDMLDFLDAPVPYVIGIKNKTPELQSKLANVVLIDVNKNQVKSSSMPQLPQHKELFSSLSPYHTKLVGESYLARRRPVYECTDVQVEAAKGFLAVLRSYLDSLCSNLRSHTITNVQSNNDKVSLLLKESFIDSFPYRDRPFMRLFVDTQLFSGHTDLVLSFYQKD
ncbi:uncharacterized protein A4U43_C06F4340 [Asparagus officinalis]|uniref:UDENN domain-containing protein n=1 Tax=Asparagus officinalis TaxID=4686 RepID=A0A5P1EMU3_ASPOF|nr:uncharacterized protein LOC109844208 [Asparagus officinalis]ONK66119.1 uncharacterized protein A4U43_C06F4340 [Asparagus officinalis]